MLGAEDANAKYYIPTMLTPFFLGLIYYNSITVGISSSLYVALWMWFVGKHKKVVVD